jgi:membrane protein implicated in regulation of membrane protease activity
MQAVYWVALVIGGGLLALFLLHDGDGEPGAGHAAEFDALGLWWPVSSLRFWIFFLAFFGLTGVAQGVVATAVPAAVRAVLAVVMGYLVAVAAGAVLRRLGSRELDSSLAQDDCVGERATVILPIERGRTGKIRLLVKGRLVDLRAESEEQHPFAVGASAMVYAVRADGVALVTAASSDLPAGEERGS